MKEVKAYGKAWNAASVTGMTADTFVNDPAHAIEGLPPEANTTALSEVYAQCMAVVAAPDPAPAVPAKAAKTKK